MSSRTVSHRVVALAAAAVLSTGIGGVAVFEQAQAASTATTRANAYPVLQYGATGRPVVMLQRLLSYNGISTTPDGSFGPGTLAGVKEYQRRQQLAVDGSVGPQTWARMLPELRYGQKSGTVTVAQLTLRDTGIAIEADGSFGPDTRAKVKSFQKANRLPVNGKLDAATWRALMTAQPGKQEPTSKPIPAPTSSSKPTSQPTSSSKPTAPATPTRSPAPSTPPPAAAQREIVLIDQLQTGPNGHDNCGPTSAVMAMIAAGHHPTGYRPNPTTEDKAAMVIAMGKRMGMQQGEGVGVDGIRKGLTASGASSTQTDTAQALAAVRQGHPVLLNGHTRNLEWMNVSRGVGHWIVVVEYRGGDNYIALDPWGGKRYETTGAAMRKFTDTLVDRDRSQNQLVIR